jgi:hypothetical protein
LKSPDVGQSWIVGSCAPGDTWHFDNFGNRFINLNTPQFFKTGSIRPEPNRFQNRIAKHAANTRTNPERRMSARYREDEKKVEDLTYLDDLDDAHMTDYRFERLERQLDQLSAELLCVKQQQVKGQHQVMELQTDLVAAELARQAAEEQLAHQQRHDHELMISLFRKFMDNPHGQNELPTVIDVTKYSDSESELHQYEQISKELQELSLAVQQHSSDQLQQREALELAWMNHKSEQCERLQHVDDDTAALYKGLKDMALTWDQKLHEMNAQIQKVRKIVASQNISSISSVGSTLVTETADKVESLCTDLAQLQQFMQRYLDSHRRINGERIVTKRKTEQDLRSIRHAIKRLAKVVFELAERMDTPAVNIMETTIEEETELDEEADEYVEEIGTFQKLDMEQLQQPILDLDAPVKCAQELLFEEADPVPDHQTGTPDEEICAVNDKTAYTNSSSPTEQAMCMEDPVPEIELEADEKPCFLGEIHSF